MDKALRSMCDVPASVIFCISWRFGWSGIFVDRSFRNYILKTTNPQSLEISTESS